MYKNNFKMALVAAAASFLFAPLTSAAIGGYSQDFESLNSAGATALSDDGWLVGANVYSPSGDVFLFNYFSFPAPNGGAAFSAIATDQGGSAQGVNQLSVYNDYNNTSAHNAGNRVEAFVFQEFNIGADDVGVSWEFSFDAKQGNISDSSTARAFIQVLDPSNGFSTTGFMFVDTTAIGTDWSSYDLSLFIDASQIGQILQFGFVSTASNFESAGVFYDNLELRPVPVPGALLFMLSALGGLRLIRRPKS